MVRARELATMGGEVASARREALLGDIGDADWRVRREAALALVRSPDRSLAIEALLDRVLGDDIEARNAALDALRTLRAEATPQVLARLGLETGPRRRFLVEALLEGVTRECLPALRALLEDADPNLPPAAIEAVSALRDGAALPVLVGALRHRDPVVRLGALIALQSRPEPAPIEALVECVRDPLTMRAALSLVAARPEPEAFEDVLRCIERGDRHALTAAARACEAAGRAGDPGLRSRLIHSASRWLPAVLGLARDRREELVVPAIWMLGHAAAPDAAHAVLGALGDARSTVRSAAEVALDVMVTHSPLLALSSAAAFSVAVHRAALRSIASSASEGGDEVLAALARAVDDPAVGFDTLAALAALAPRSRHDAVWRRLGFAMRRWPDREEPGAIAQTLLARGAAPPVEPVFEATPAGLSVALSWVRARGSLDPALVDEALASTDAAVQALGLQLVEALGGPRWAPASEALLDHPSLRGHAIGAVRACGVEARTLNGWLRDERPGRRMAAVLSLGDRSLLPQDECRALLDDPDPEVALAALHALGAEVPREWLHGLMRRGDPTLAQEALAMIRAAAPGAALELEFEALQHADAGVRSAALASLDPSSQDVRARLYLRLAEERDPEVAMCIERLLEG
jgi:hypothetical protein